MDNIDIQPEANPRRWAILGVLCLSLLLIVVDNTIVNVALPTFVRELHATTSQLQWIVDAYTLFFACLLLTAGALGDRRGRKGMLTLGLIVFGAASLAAALGSSTGQVIAARAVMGIGAAMIMPATLSILTNVFTNPKERAAAIGIWSAVSGLAIALGPVSGGFLLEHFWWGSIFLVNVPIVVIALIAGGAMIPTSKDGSTAKLDLKGATLSVIGLGALVWAVIEAPSKGWTSTPILAAFAVGAVVLVAFAILEARLTDPMLNVRFFKNMRFTAASLSITLLFFALTGFIFGVAQYLQGVLGYSALSAGVRTLPFAAAVMVFAPMSPKLVDRVGTKALVAGGLGTFAVGLLIASTMKVDSPYSLVMVAMLVMGSGMGLAMAPATESVMGSLPREAAGVGSAVNDTTRELGSTLGVAIGGSAIASVYSGRIGDALAGQPLPVAALKAAKDSLGGALAVAQQAGEQGPALATVARKAFTDGLRVDTLITAGVAVLGMIIAAAFLPSRAEEAIIESSEEEQELVSAMY
jgi:EmrB/QacA subfamily drug resistance transporter